jgi:TPR repeat protein
MPVDRARPAAHDPRSRFSLAVAIVGLAGVVGLFLPCAGAVSSLSAAAQSSQGSGDDSGRGVPQDRSQAAAWYRKGAEQGDARAQFNLGLMYRYGPGYSPGLEEWAMAFNPAPGHTGATARSSPAAKYSPGSGIPKDYVEAHKWMSLAAARATGDSQKRFENERDSLARVMTPEQIAEAERRAREWTAAFEKRKK